MVLFFAFLSVNWKREHPYTWYPLCDLGRSPKLTCKTHLLNNQLCIPNDKLYISWWFECPRQGVPCDIYLSTMGDLCNGLGEKYKYSDTNDLNTEKKNKRNVYFCVVHSRYFSKDIHRVINRLKIFNILWLIVQMSYHIFNNLFEILNR